MPNQPRPGEHARAVRVPDALWRAAKERAAEKGETVSDVIRRALERYVKTPTRRNAMIPKAVRKIGPVIGPDGTGIALLTNDDHDEATLRRLAAEAGASPELIDALFDPATPRT